MTKKLILTKSQAELVEANILLRPRLRQAAKKNS